MYSIQFSGLTPTKTRLQNKQVFRSRLFNMHLRIFLLLREVVFTNTFEHCMVICQKHIFLEKVNLCEVPLIIISIILVYLISFLIKI